MKFFILGDSWGLGEWKFVDGIPHESGIVKNVPDTSIEFYLSQHGHYVKNISAVSAGNFGQLRHAYWQLVENHRYDYIIWFHIEPT